MLAAIRGESVDQIPWAPRMDLWAIAHRARGTTPARFVGMNTAQLADELDVSCHAVRGDFTLPREPEDLALRGLGFDNHPDYPFRVELRDLPFDFTHHEGIYETTIHASAGDVTTRLQMTRQMSADGISLPFVEKYAISSLSDLEAVAQVFEHLEVIPTPRAYSTFQERLGERGLAVANGPLAATPMHLLLHDLMPMEEFFVNYLEERSALEGLAARMQPFYDAMLDAIVASSAEVFLWGANYDRDTTWAPFFVEQIQPALKRISERAHAAGKLLLTHTDGENAGLLQHYPGCGFDVGESVCPTPMTSLSLAQIRDGFGKTAVWGGIPCVILLNESATDAEFNRYMDDLFSNLGSGRRLILGVSDNVPPDVNLSRLEKIQDWINAFGAVH
jgi:hypothetical protein